MAIGAILPELGGSDDFSLLAIAVAQFAERELVPYFRQLGRDEFPHRFLTMAGEHEFLGIAVPEEYGGQGGTLEGFLPVIEGLAACDGSAALTLAAHESLATTHLLLGADAEQKRKYLPALTAGKTIGAWCLTEPQAGSNIFSDTRTTLVSTGEGLRLNGEKTFITNGCRADLFVVLAKAISENGQDAGMTACVVERNGNQGRITSTPLHEKMGMRRSDTASIKFDDVPVADEAVLEPLGSGGKVARRVLLRGRIGIGALALGLARDSLERAVAYSKDRKVAGGSLFDQPLTQAKLSRMEESLWVAWQGIRAAARLADASKPFKVQACMAKVFATEAALRIIDEAIQILGGYGYMGEYKVEQNFRDARLLTIGEGATEILRFAIAGNLWAAKGDDADVLPTLEGLADTAGPYGSSLGYLGASGWRALQIAVESVHIAREHLDRDGQQSTSDPTWQCRAAAFADLATRLWVTLQAAFTSAGLVHRESAAQKHLTRATTFVANSSVEICHQASDSLRTLGVMDTRLLNNYAEAIRIAATGKSPSRAPLTVKSE